MKDESRLSPDPAGGTYVGTLIFSQGTTTHGHGAKLDSIRP